MKTALLSAALAASFPQFAGAQEQAPSPGQEEPSPEQADPVATLRQFVAAAETGFGDAVPIVAAAKAAEARLTEWPATLPDRATLRALIQIAEVTQQGVTAFQQNNLLRVNFESIFEQVFTAMGQIKRDQVPRAWANAQVATVEVMQGAYMVVRAFSPPNQAAEMLAGARRFVEPLLADQGAFDPRQRIILTRTLANMLAPPGPFRANTDDVEGGIELHRRAVRMALESDFQTLARDSLVTAASLSLQRDPSAARAEQILSERYAGPVGWLNRRSVHHLRMRIALARSEHETAQRYSDLWLTALEADLRTADTPFWAAGIPDDDQTAYLVGPLQRGDPRTSLAHFERLGAVTAIDRPARSIGILEHSEGHRFQAPDPGATDPALFGVDTIVVAGTVSATPMRAFSLELLAVAAMGDTTPIPPAATLHWGAISRREGRRQETAASSQLDFRVTAAENGRGLASLMPSIMQAMSGRALPLEAIEQLRAVLAEKIPVYDAMFFEAFGKPIDDLAGGRCASAEPLRGATPRILLVMPASFSFFPVEMARAPNGRRLIDCYEFRRTPTLEVARNSAARWRNSQPLRRISIARDLDGDLYNAIAEIPLIAAAAGDRQAIVPLDPTSAASILRPAGNVDVVHLSAHGRVGLLDPYESSVGLPGGGALTYRAISQMPERATALLVILSACEAGLSTPRAGEVAHWGLASALLSAGTGGVIGALWQVSDDAAALVMGKFYERLLKEGRDPSAAIREAQLWLREATADQLLDYVEASASFADEVERPYLATLRAAITSRAAAAADGATPYRDPLLWGGFGYFGTYAAD